MRRLLLLAFLACGPVFAQEFKLGDLSIDQPMAFETPKLARAGGGFMSVTNTGDTDDILLEVKTDFPMTQIRRTEIDANGIATMNHVDRLDIPAGQTIELKPGGLHIMFMGLKPGEGLTLGDTFKATLVFEKAGEVEVEFMIKKRTHGAGH